jgi:transposase InsO family protein
MQIKSLRIKSYRSWRINETVIGTVAQKRHAILQTVTQLRSEGCSEKTALNVVGISRATFYRWKKSYITGRLNGLTPGSKRPVHCRKPGWNRGLQELVAQIRVQYPYWGKLKIHRILERDYAQDISVSTIGRILRHLVQRKKIYPVAWVTGRKKRARRRVFNKHAQRWVYGMKAKKPGELIQIDHMTANLDGCSVKDFKAICPITKYLITEVYSNATSHTASKFLDKLISAFPFPVQSIQVDGGSEFMKDFEETCRKKCIELYVLPPKSPKYNGCVERTNGTSRDEFYSQYKGELTVAEVRPALREYQAFFNGYRPHQSLANLTPMEYIRSTYQKEAA